MVTVDARHDNLRPVARSSPSSRPTSTTSGPKNGAKVVARWWTDATYRERLVADPTAAVAELGFGGRQGEHLVAVESTSDLHHVVACTLCSCYPWTVLGLPPTWYKSPAYRSRVVIDPPGVLADFGLILPDSTRVAVHDSTAEVRYLVVPRRPGDRRARGNCTAARAAGAAPLGTGDPGYRAGLDRDGDGIACE